MRDNGALIVMCSSTELMWENWESWWQRSYLLGKNSLMRFPFFSFCFSIFIIALISFILRFLLIFLPQSRIQKSLCISVSSLLPSFSWYVLYLFCFFLYPPWFVFCHLIFSLLILSSNPFLAYFFFLYCSFICLSCFHPISSMMPDALLSLSFIALPSTSIHLSSLPLLSFSLLTSLHLSIFPSSFLFHSFPGDPNRSQPLLA